MKKITLMLFLLFLGLEVSMAQGRIEGTVVDNKGEPLAGVSVAIKGTSTGVITNRSGQFAIEVPSNDSYLEFSFIGFDKQEAKAVSGMKVSLESRGVLVDEVVVTGMTSVDKRYFTGATDRLNARDVKLDGMPEISRALEGRSAGVTVQNVSGTFGTAPRIRVRGATSIYGSSKPLWVVDGVIMEDVTEVDADALSSGDAETLISSAIAGLNSDDIESFQILKDGSATSIYGARAMAGVIVITTKKGKAGVTSINYTGEFSTRLVPSYNNFNIMNSQEQMGIYQELDDKGWLNFSSIFRANTSGVYGKMYQMMNTYNPETGTFLLPNTVDGRNSYLREAEMRNTDWFQELFRPSIVQNHSVGISGGTEKANYYTSISAMTDPGWSVASNVDRYTANMNSSYKILKNLSMNMISNASYRKQKAPGTLGQELDVVGGAVKRNFDINPYSYALNTSRALSASESYTRNYAPFNILNELENNYIDLDVVDLRFQTELKWKVIPELEFAVLAAIKYSGSNMEHHIKDNSNQAMAYRAMADATIMDNNTLLYKDPLYPYSLPISILPNGGIYERTDNKMMGYDIRPTVTWSKNFNSIHHTHFFGGMEVNSADRQKTWFRGWGRQYTMGDVPFYAYQVFKRGVEEGSEYFNVRQSRIRSAAFFGTGTYSYKGKYTANGTVRYEGTNKLGKSRTARWLPTWNIAGAWNMHEEDFMRTIDDKVSHLTLRATYSLVADRGPAFVSNSLPILNSKKPWRPDAETQENGIYIDNIENSELTYEKKNEFNIGLDLGMFRNRVNITTDFYTRNNFDLIGSIATEGVGGIITKYANVAEMKSHGFEFSLFSKNVEREDFSWTSNFIFSTNKIEITNLESRARVLDLITNNGFGKKGYSYRSLFSIPFVGLNNQGIPVFINENGDETSTGVYFQERELTDFLIYEGPAEPTITGSFGNVFSYKNFKLNIFMTYSFGNKIRLDPSFRGSYSDLDATPKEFKNRWMSAGDEAFTDIPAIATRWQYFNIANLNYAYNSYNYSTARVADGGFIRMKEISLTYDFPKSILRNTSCKNLSLKVQGTNLFLLYADSKLNGQDPEFFRSGGVSVPVPKQFTFTLRVGF